MRVALFSLALVAAALLACAGASHEIVGPGTYSVSCKRNQSNCWKEASEVCPSGYDIIDGQGHESAFINRNVYTGEATGVTPVYSGEMLVKCR